MRSAFYLILFSLTLVVTDAAAQQVPVLRYTPPPNTFRQGLATPEDYTFNGFDASVQFYPFRPFSGNIQQTDAAQRSDPENSGRYTVDRGSLIIQMGGASPETIVAAVPQGGLVTINTVLYKRQ